MKIIQKSKTLSKNGGGGEREVNFLSSRCDFCLVSKILQYRHTDTSFYFYVRIIIELKILCTLKNLTQTQILPSPPPTHKLTKINIKYKQNGVGGKILWKTLFVVKDI